MKSKQCFSRKASLAVDPGAACVRIQLNAATRWITQQTLCVRTREVHKMAVSVHKIAIFSAVPETPEILDRNRQFVDLPRTNPLHKDRTDPIKSVQFWHFRRIKNHGLFLECFFASTHQTRSSVRQALFHLQQSECGEAREAPPRPPDGRTFII